jgi:hypothetical protein
MPDLMQTVVALLSSFQSMTKMKQTTCEHSRYGQLASRYAPSDIAIFQAPSRGTDFSHSFLTSSGSVNCKRAIHFQDMEISTLATLQAL